MKKSLQKFIVWLRYNLYFDDFCIFLFFCFILLLLMLASACKSPKYIEHETVVHYIDSTIINYVDSVIEIPVPVEKVVNVVAYPDTLNLETSIAKATAYVDTATNTLKGTLENKPDGTLTKTVYLPSKERIVYRDSIRDREIPVEVKVVKYKVPPITKWLIVVLLALVGFAYRKYITRLFKLIVTAVF